MGRISDTRFGGHSSSPLCRSRGDTRMGKLMKSYEITPPAKHRLRLQRMMPFEYFSSPIYFKLSIGYCRYVGRTIEYSDSIDTIQQWNSKYMYCEANTINPECLIVELGVGCATSNKYNWRILTKNNFFQLPHQWYVIGRGEVNLETKRISNFFTFTKKKQWGIQKWA